MLYALAILNLLLTGALFVVVWRLRTLTAKPVFKIARKSSLKPIRHEPIQSPLVPIAQSIGGGIVSYFHTKLKPDEIPFIATYYKDPQPGAGVSKADMFVTDDGKRIPGPLFRIMYEPAQVAQQIGKLTMERSHTQGRKLATARNTRVVLKPYP
jgi:hypothetical protein